MNIKPFPLLAAVFCLVAGSNAADVMSLAGDWRFSLDRDDAGVREQWFDNRLPDTIQLPGVLQSQGFGDPISIHTPWVLTLYDHFWYLRADYAGYTNEGQVKVPFLCQPPRHYLGAAWYQRDMEIPRDWSGKRVTLFLERPHWKTTLWLDNKEIGSDTSLCVPHEYDLGTVSPGKHRLTVRVDNRMILPYGPDAHSVSDSLGAAWNGIVGTIQLQASDPVCIERMRLDPDLDRRGIKVTLYTRNDTGKPVKASLVQLQVAPENFDGNALKALKRSAVIGPGDTNLALFFPMGNHFQQWSEFNPMCYILRATIGGRNFHSEIASTFGMREFKAVGNQFILNGRPIYLRGTHFGGDFPMTGYPPTDLASWKKIFRTCKEYGLNHVRFHSWCPPEAAFEAADDLGFYLQIEPGMWNSFKPGGEMLKMLYNETEGILRDYGNHPSLMLISASNEAHGNWKLCLSQWVEHFSAEDPRRLYTPDTGWALFDRPGPVKGANYLDVAHIGKHPIRGVTGWFGRDFSNSVAGVNVPVVSHEIGQWCAYPDFDIIKKFTGYMRPGNYEIFRDSLAAHGMADMDQEFAWASGRFQLECYKEEIEANLRTPGLNGFQLLDLHDYTGQGTALVGLLDTFWDSKGYVTPAEFREFCNSVVPLARLTNRVFTTTDSFEVPVEVANYGQVLTNAPVVWEIIDSSNHVVANGSLGVRTIPIGKNVPLGEISTDLSQLSAPAGYKLAVRVGDDVRSLQSHSQPPHVGSYNIYRNDWNFWLYPGRLSSPVPSDILVTRSWEAAAAKLAGGGKVLFLPDPKDLSWAGPPLADVPIFWNRPMFPHWTGMLGLWCETNHPALAEFPTEPNCDWQWTQILRGARAVNLDGLPPTLHPIVQAIDDWNRNWKLGVVFDCNVGAGKLMFCTMDLERHLDQRPVARQLRRSLLDYMTGKDFHPKTTISSEQFRSLHFDSRIMQTLGATAQADGVDADAAIDGNPDTYWSLGQRRGEKPVPFPHELTISFPHPVSMNGLVLMSRQDDLDHPGDTCDYRIEIADDNGGWKNICAGALASTWDPQTIHFAHAVTTTQLKFVALSDFGDDNTTALAELAVLQAGPGLPDENGNAEKPVR